MHTWRDLSGSAPVSEFTNIRNISKTLCLHPFSLVENMLIIFAVCVLCLLYTIITRLFFRFVRLKV